MAEADLGSEDKDTEAGAQAGSGKASVLAKAELFTDFGLWKPELRRSSERWLNNFHEGEQRLAVTLLNSFLYFSDAHATQLMVSGFQDLSARLFIEGLGPKEIRQKWTDFCDSIVVCSVEGETPNPTDSGHEAARKFRYTAQLPQARYATCNDAFELAVFDQAQAVVWVDDFVGSGNQFIETWRRQRVVVVEGAVQTGNFADIAKQVPEFRAYFCPSICTEYALKRIRDACPSVIVSPGILLSERYDALHPDSLIWPDDLRAEGQDMVRAVSQRLGLNDTSKGQDDLRGFHALGLALAVRDMIPDATLRLFRYDDNWNPLMKVVS